MEFDLSIYVVRLSYEATENGGPSDDTVKTECHSKYGIWKVRAKTLTLQTLSLTDKKMT